MTNAIAFVKCFTNDFNFNASVVYNTIDTNQFRGNNVALAINDRTTNGKDISRFKFTMIYYIKIITMILK